MSGAKNGLIKTSERKQRRTTTPVWLPKSVPLSTNEDCRMYSSSCGQCSPKAVESVSEIDGMLNTSHNGMEPEGPDEEDDFQEDVPKEVSLGTNTVLAPEKVCFSVSIEAGSLIRFVKGKHGFTQRQIEDETGVKIIFPSSKKETCIVIESTSMDNASKASEKIGKILEEAAKSPNLDYSHFVSLPLAIHGELVEKFTMFQNSILGETDPGKDDNPGTSSDEDCLVGEDNRESQANESNMAVNLKVLEEGQHIKVELVEKSANHSLSDLGIDRSIFIKPKTLHLTVLMLKLYNKERLSLAAEVLQNLSSKVKDALDNRPIFIRLKGLACMRGSPGKARVVYAPVEEIGGEGRLSRACRAIIDAYLEAGLILKEDAKQTLKLHATLMNVRHRKRKKKRVHKFDSFDARTIFKKYGSEEWGEYLIREAHLSQRFEFNEDGYYHCCTSIPFPEQMQVE